VQVAECQLKARGKLGALCIPSSPRPPASLLRKLIDPGHHLLNLRINHRLDTRVDDSILNNQIRAVNTVRNDKDRVLRRAMQRAARTIVAANSRVSPGVELAVDEEQTGDGLHLCHVPAISVRVHGGRRIAGRFIGVAVLGREVERALALPVLCGD